MYRDLSTPPAIYQISMAQASLIHQAALQMGGYGHIYSPQMGGLIIDLLVLLPQPHTPEYALKHQPWAVVYLCDPPKEN